MITTDFAPNETFKDAWLSLQMIFDVKKWKSEELSNDVQEKLRGLFPTNHNHVHLFLSARAGLYFLLKSLNLPKGTRIAVQGYTCEAVVLPILAVGYEPVYVDIDPQTFSFDPQDLVKKLEDVKVVILQHTYGIAPDRNGILDVLNKREVLVIEDLAHGFQKEAFVSHPQTIKLLSFGRSKAVSSVFGGAVLFNDDLLDRRLSDVTRDMKIPPVVFLLKLLLYKPFALLIKSSPSNLAKVFHLIGKKTGILVPEVTMREKKGSFDTFTNYRYVDTLARLLLFQLSRYDIVQRQRKEFCVYYQEKFRNQNKYLKGSLIRYPLLLDNRDEILTRLQKKQIYLGSWYTQPIAPKGILQEKLGYKPGMCKTAEEITKKIITLPTTITRQEAEVIVEHIQRVKYENS